jgi:LPXTG-motif cell wall-anchored protein
MKSKKQVLTLTTLWGSLVAFTLATLLLFPAPGLASFSNLPTASLVGNQPTIRILTLNVMQRAVVDGVTVPRADRFANIVNYLNSNPPVHALALQELSGGWADGTTDSGADLAGMLGGQYGYYTESSFGFPPFIAFKVGVMPRYTMKHTAATALIPPGDYQPDPSYYIDFTGRANVVMCVMDIPGFGVVNLYSTHFYTGESIQTQATNLMEFVNNTEVHPSRATIVAGDMNFFLSQNTQGIYDTFLTHGFQDSYREVNDDPGYTFGVANNPYAPSTTPKRIDFIFVRGEDLEISSSQVVFDGINGNYVSDHYGVITTITSTPLPSSLFLLGTSLVGLAGLGFRRRRRKGP